MLQKFELHKSVLNRNTLVALSPIIFLLLLVLWTLFNIGLSPVQASTSSTAVFAVVQRSSANIRRGPGTQYGIRGSVRKGALLPVSGQYVNEAGERWYKITLRAFGDAWVSAIVVEISPANADIPIIGMTTPTVTLPEISLPQSNNQSSNNSNSGSSTSVPQAPTPATTPDPGA